jgi:hypothetical protein
MLLSDSVGGAEDNRNGLAKRIPVKVTDRSTAIIPLLVCAAGETVRIALRKQRGRRGQHGLD